MVLFKNLNNNFIPQHAFISKCFYNDNLISIKF